MKSFKKLVEESLNERKDDWEVTGKPALVPSNDKIVRDILELGNGTIGNLFNLSKYRDIEKALDKWILWVRNNKKPFKTWSYAWEDYKKLVEESLSEKVNTSPNYLIGKKIKVKDSDSNNRFKGEVGIIYGTSDSSNSVYVKFGKVKAQLFPTQYDIIK